MLWLVLEIREKAQMLLRQFRLTVHDGKAEEFEPIFRDHILPLLKRQDGLVWVAAGKPWQGDPNTFCMTMPWRDLDAIKAFAGDNWIEARIEPEERHLIAATSLEQFELLGTVGP